MVPGPTAVVILDLRESDGHVIIPLLPGFTPGNDQRFAGEHIAEKLFTTIIAKPRQHTFIFKLGTSSAVLLVGLSQIFRFIIRNSQSLERLTIYRSIPADLQSSALCKPVSANWK